MLNPLKIQPKLTALLLVSLALSACTDPAQQQSSAQIVVTSHPLQLIAEQILSAEDQLKLVGGGSDSHHFALSPSELGQIRASDLVLWLGGDTQPSLEKLLEDTNSAEPKDWIGLPANRSHHGELDPHFWFSTAQVQSYAAKLAEKLSLINPEHAQEYASNLERFTRQLHQIDEQTADYQGTAYIAYIDAYRSLEQQTGLEFDGAITEHDQPLQASRIKQAASSRAKCLLSPTLVNVPALEQLNTVIIDELLYGYTNYPDALKGSLAALQDCL